MSSAIRSALIPPCWASSVTAAIWSRGDLRAAGGEFAAVAFPGRLQALERALADHRGFPFGEGGHDVEDQLAVRCARVDVLVEHFEFHAALAEEAHDVDEVDKAAAHAVELGHHEDVARAEV